ncbi:unnamed protein product, partial [Prorocentrum cordatum]
GHRAWHGNVVGSGLLSICQQGLRGYRADAYTVKAGTSRPGDVLVTPSRRLALECYGFEHRAEGGDVRYRVALETEVQRDAHISKGRDTVNARPTDPRVPHEEMEWSVPRAMSASLALW